MAVQPRVGAIFTRPMEDAGTLVTNGTFMTAGRVVIP